MAPVPLGAHDCSDHGHSYTGPKTVLFLVDRAGISETGILKI